MWISSVRFDVSHCELRSALNHTHTHTIRILQTIYLYTWRICNVRADTMCCTSFNCVRCVLKVNLPYLMWAARHISDRRAWNTTKHHWGWSAIECLVPVLVVLCVPQFIWIEIGWNEYVLNMLLVQGSRNEFRVDRVSELKAYWSHIYLIIQNICRERNLDAFFCVSALHTKCMYCFTISTRLGHTTLRWIQVRFEKLLGHIILHYPSLACLLA